MGTVFHSFSTRNLLSPIYAGFHTGFEAINPLSADSEINSGLAQGNHSVEGGCYCCCARCAESVGCCGWVGNCWYFAESGCFGAGFVVGVGLCLGLCSSLCLGLLGLDSSLGLQGGFARMLVLGTNSHVFKSKLRF